MPLHETLYIPLSAYGGAVFPGVFVTVQQVLQRHGTHQYRVIHEEGLFQAELLYGAKLGVPEDVVGEVGFASILWEFPRPLCWVFLEKMVPVVVPGILAGLVSEESADLDVCLSETAVYGLFSADHSALRFFSSWM